MTPVNNFYIYRIANLRVIDGDTVDMDIDLGFDVWLRNQRVRLSGIDAPETRTRDLDEKMRGMEAKRWLEKRIAEAHEIILESDEFDPHDKYGRILGTLHVWDGKSTEAFDYIDIDWEDLNMTMIDEKLVKSYDGGKR